MRKFVLIAAMVLVSAAAQAGETRSLSLAAVEPPAAPTQQPAVTEPAKIQTVQTTETVTPAETPKFVERPAVVDTTTAATTPAQPKADAAKPAPQTAKADTKADKPKHKKYWTEARIIGELHRHGIYW